MKQVWKRHVWRLGAAVLTGIAAVSSIAPAQAAPWTGRDRFAARAFEDVWKASDQAVVSGQVSRSWTWGPSPWFDYKEIYRNSPNGLRQVQYFDKSRMEINNPANSTTRGVTNGLLVVEMVSGRVKLGDGIGYDDNLQRVPAQVPVAGDPGNVNPNAPTYASFVGVATTDNGYRDPDRTGQRVSAVLDKQGNRTNNVALSNDPATEIVAYNTITGHNVPRVFRDFINGGPVDGVFAFGYPIADPYWIRAKVGGVEKDILVQLYERRVVTYTPGNPQAFRVEMGNVGQHYFQWRYPDLGQPWLPNADQLWTPPIAYASKAADPNVWQVYLLGNNGMAGPQITAGPQETVPYAWRRTYVGGAAPRLMVDSRRDTGTRKVFSINAFNYADVQAHTVPSMPEQVFNPAISPDGTLIVMVVDYFQYSTLSIQPFGAGMQFPAGMTTVENCNFQSPAWLPDGSGLIYASNCEGKFAIYRADLRVNWAASDQSIGAELVNVRKLTNTPTVDNYFPRISPDGTRIVYTSNRNGLGDVYIMNLDGTGERRITSNPADDGAATWSPDGMALVFDSNRDGDYDLYRIDVTPTNLGPEVQLTNNTVDDRWAIWAQ